MKNTKLLRRSCIIFFSIMMIKSQFSSASNIILSAGSCGCTYLIPNDLVDVKQGDAVKNPDGTSAGTFNPSGGQVICLLAGARPQLKFYNFNGSASNPVIIKNCEGQVDLFKPGSSYVPSSGFVDAIRIHNCRYIKLTGTGDPAYTYGIKISQSYYTGTDSGNGVGIDITRQDATLGESTYPDFIEIEYLEITQTGFAAIRAKVNGVDKNANTLMTDLRFHHNYIHDLQGGEGFYIGNTAWGPGATADEHNLDNIYVHNNKLENIPCEGIQVGGTYDGNAWIYENEIINYGTAPFTSDQDNGIQLGKGFSGKCYNNFIKKGIHTTGGNGIIVLGVGNVDVFNNVVIEAMEDGIYVGNQTAESGKPFRFYNNTIIDPVDNGIDYEVPTTTSIGEAKNNIITLAASPYINPCTPTCSLTQISNYHETNVANYTNLFIDAANYDFRLKSGANVIDIGTSLSTSPYGDLGIGLTNDNQDNLRPYNSNYDIGAFEYDPLRTASVPTSVCAGGTVTITFSSDLSCGPYSTILSNAAGSFSSGTTNLGTITSGSSVTIPGVAVGNGYRIRMEGGAGTCGIGMNNGKDFKIIASPVSSDYLLGSYSAAIPYKQAKTNFCAGTSATDCPSSGTTTIANGGYVSIIAGSRITLHPGFSTTLTSNGLFLARIIGDVCTTNYYQARKGYFTGSEDYIPASAQISEASGLITYPNPNSGKFTIKVVANNKEVKGNISIFDIFGRKVFEQSLDTETKENCEVDLSNYSAGMYIIRLDNEKDTLLQKIILNK